MRTLKAVPLLALVFAGCKATLGGPGEAGSDGGGLGSGGPGAGQLDRDEPCDPSALPPSPVRRLSHREYRRSIEHLFPGLAVDLPTLAADRAVHGYENFASQLNPSDLLVEQYLTAAVTFMDLRALSRRISIGRLIPAMTSTSPARMSEIAELVTTKTGIPVEVGGVHFAPGDVHALPFAAASFARDCASAESEKLTATANSEANAISERV